MSVKTAEVNAKVDLVRELIEGKADVNRTLRDEGGLTWTTLSIAASRNRLDMCKLLLRGRARVYPTNEDGRQAVWFAARDGYSAVAMALIEGLIRLLPGVLGNPDSVRLESFGGDLLEGPQYTRPPEYRGLTVPAVLRSGDHAAIERFRRQAALERTRTRRPDLLERDEDD